MTNVYAGEEFVFLLNFENSFLYVNDRTSKIEDGRDYVKKQILELAKNCEDCIVTVIEQDTVLRKKFRSHRRVQRIRKKIQIKKYKKGKFYYSRTFLNLEKALNSTGPKEDMERSKHLFYFGHTLKKKKLHEELNDDELIKMLDHLTVQKTYPFDTIVLSSCANGSLKTLLLLSPFSKYIIAAPSNIHLSMLRVSTLEEGYEKYIDQSFESLISLDTTETSISLYESDSLLNEFDISKSMKEIYKNRSRFILYNRYNKPKFGKSFLEFTDLL